VRISLRVPRFDLEIRKFEQKHSPAKFPLRRPCFDLTNLKCGENSENPRKNAKILGSLDGQNGQGPKWFNLELLKVYRDFQLFETFQNKNEKNNLNFGKIPTRPKFQVKPGIPRILGQQDSRNLTSKIEIFREVWAIWSLERRPPEI
jgi:hypothetical protein